MKWEYCEVINRSGEVSVIYLTEEGSGWKMGQAFRQRYMNNMDVALAQLGSELAPQRKGKNMAVTLAQLGGEGWEIVAISLMGGGAYVPYTSVDAESRAFLKRGVPN